MTTVDVRVTETVLFCSGLLTLLSVVVVGYTLPVIIADSVKGDVSTEKSSVATAGTGMGTGT